MAKVLAERRQQRAQGTTGLPKPRKGRGSVVDADESTLRDFLSRYPDMTVVRLLEEVRARGYRRAKSMSETGQSAHRAPTNLLRGKRICLCGVSLSRTI